MKDKAVVLLSGGLDSATVYAIAINRGYDVYALSADYGQEHRKELECACHLVQRWGARAHHVVTLDLSFAGSSLLGSMPVTGQNEDIPSTYVPARNTILLGLALAWAETLDAHDVFLGINAVDYGGYPDCRPAFLEAFQALANVATWAGVEGRPIRIHAPLLKMSKAEIIKTGLELGVRYEWTNSCYRPYENGIPCGVCNACQVRRRGFQELGIVDPLTHR